MNIKGKFVTLRAIEESDSEMLRSMLNDPDIEDAVVGWAFPVSAYQQKQWFLNNNNNPTNQRLIIETVNDGAVGMATLVSIDWKNRSATHGIKLAKKDNRTKGIGTDTVMAVMRYAFDHLQLHRLDGSWFASNVASVNLYKKCGWREEGIRREYVYKNGVYIDLTLAGILANEYYDLIEKNRYWEQ